LNPDAVRFLAKARSLMRQGELMLDADLFEAAARTAYMIAFHVAEAVICEATGRVAKTHRGVQSEFGRLTREQTGAGRDLREYLAKAYSFKTVADYDTDVGSEIDEAEARNALATARKFYDHFAPIAPP
jgi:uncharacterized protein (UPF0332 family)